FRLEGEEMAEQHPLVTEKLNPYVPNGPTWVARLGSRRERAFWNSETKQWVDLLRLRLLRSEYEQIATAGEADAIRATEGPRSTGRPGSAPTATRLPPQSQCVSAATGGPR